MIRFEISLNYICFKNEFSLLIEINSEVIIRVTTNKIDK